jgi:hypothetical protein
MEHFLYRLIGQLLARICGLHPLALASCVAWGFFYLAIWDANQSSNGARQFEQEMALLREIEAMKQADHKRLMEILEALKPRRDLTLPAEPDEGF